MATHSNEARAPVRNNSPSAKSSYHSSVSNNHFEGFTEEDIEESTARSNDGKAITSLTVGEMKSLFIDSLFSERAQRAIEASIEGRIQPIAKRIEPLERKTNAHETEIAELRERIKHLEGKKTMIATEVDTSRRNNLIFTGIQGNNEEVYNKIGRIIEDLGIKLSGPYNVQTKGRDAMVEFSAYWDKRKTYAVRTKLNAKGHRGVFLNEDLTSTQKNIFYMARIARKQGLIQSAWTYNGVTNMSKVVDGTVQTKEVTTEEELKTLLPELIIPPQRNNRNQNFRSDRRTEDRREENNEPPTRTTETEQRHDANGTQTVSVSRKNSVSKIPEPAKIIQSNSSNKTVTTWEDRFATTDGRAARERSPERRNKITKENGGGHNSWRKGSL